MNWIITPDKYLSDTEVQRLVRTCTDAARLAQAKGDWMLIDLALNTGLRVAELAHLHIKDLHLKYGEKSLTVRNGKGGKQRVVKFGSSLKTHLKDYLATRAEVSSYVFASSRQDRMTRSAMQKVFKKWAKCADLPEHYSIHSLRHTYATRLYKASDYNLRLVQKQLGHSSPSITSVYADALDADIEAAVERLHQEPS